jgi:hypothetical protein
MRCLIGSDSTYVFNITDVAPVMCTTELSFVL